MEAAGDEDSDRNHFVGGNHRLVAAETIHGNCGDLTAATKWLGRDGDDGATECCRIHGLGSRRVGHQEPE